MSSRALRRAQREREEQEQLQKLHEHDEVDDDHDVSVLSAKPSAFAMLGAEDGEADDDIGSKTLDDYGEGISPDQPTQGSIPKASRQKKKKKKKPKATESGPGLEPADEEMDEIDRALKQLATNGHTSQEGATVAGSDPKVDELNSLLAIDPNHLHAQNEMRRLFGRAALEQQDGDQPPPRTAGGNRRQQRRAQHVGLAQALRGQGARAGGLASLALKRNIFIQPKEEWPVATGGGLSMEVEEKRADGIVLYRYVHNRAYQDVQEQFQSCVESMDPNRMVLLLQHNPFHISTLLQVSEIAKQERDHATSGDLLERALFSLGRAVHSTFAKNVAEGRARLDFRRGENREFWLASWRYMQNLSMRGTWRTVYEWAKLLLALSPEDDPYAIWLVLDQYALRARQDLDYLNISNNAAVKSVHKDMPNVQLSRGLAEHRAGNKNKGNQALFTAIGRFPSVVARLMQELDIRPPPAIWGKEPRMEKEKLHAELYATRAKDLWNTPETSALLNEIASAIPEGTPAEPVDISEISESEARHVLLSDTPRLIALVPRKYTAALQSASDPLPPNDSYPSYLTDRSRDASGGRPVHPQLRNNADNLRELQSLYGFFSNLFPWFNPTSDMDGQAEPRPSEEEIERRIQESGLDQRLVVERTQRLMELQHALGANIDFEDHAAEAPTAGQVGAVQTPSIEPENGSRHARVEDTSDNDD